MPPHSIYSTQPQSGPPSSFMPIPNALGHVEDRNANRIDNRNRPDDFALSRSPIRQQNNQMSSEYGIPQYDTMKYQYSDYYFEGDCNCSHCNPYSDYGFPGEIRTPMPRMYSFDGGASDCLYSGPNWFPMGDPTYSVDMYHNPYQVSGESPPPYTEESAIKLPRGRSRSRSRTPSSRTNRSRPKSGSSKYSFDHANSQDRVPLRDAFRTKSLPNLMQQDFYSDGPSSPTIR